MTWARKAVYTLGRAFKEGGEALTQTAGRISGESTAAASGSHRTLVPISGVRPAVSNNAWVAPSATVAGDVVVGDNSSVWYGSVIRGDENHVRIGTTTNVQDNTVITTIRSSETGFTTATKIGSNVTIGHGCTIVSATIGDDCLIGMGSIINDGAWIQSGSMLAAGAVVYPGVKVPAGQLWAGNPAKYVRNVDDDERKSFTEQASKYFSLSKEHRSVA